MNKRSNILVLFLITLLLLCEVSLPVTDSSYSIVSDMASASGQLQGQALSPVATTSFSELGTPELISGRGYGSIFRIRSQTEGKESQRSIVRILLLFVLALCLLQTPLQHLRYRLLLPEKTGISSAILSYIHRKDGKK